MIQQLKKREPHIQLSHYISNEIENVICDELEVPCFIDDEKNESKSENQKHHDDDDNNDEVDYSYAMKRNFRKDSKTIDEKDFEHNFQ